MTFRLALFALVFAVACTDDFTLAPGTPGSDSGSDQPTADTISAGDTAPAEGVIVDDDFTTRDRFIDLSLQIPWGEHPLGSTAFALGTSADKSALSLIRSGEFDTILYSGFENDHQLRAFSSIDYEFPAAVDHATHVTTVAFDARWDETSATGENGRIVFTLVHSYPKNGPKVGDFDDFASHPYGRPAYTLSLRNGADGVAGGEPFLQYGGGAPKEGTFGIYASSWWLPGYAESPGGGVAGGGEPFPNGGSLHAATGVAKLEWQHFAFIIWPDRMELVRDGASLIDFPLPKNSSTAPVYFYFSKIQALRIYFAARQQAYLANLRVTVRSIVSGG